MVLEHSKDDVWKLICWSLYWLQLGKWPEVDVDGFMSLSMFVVVDEPHKQVRCGVVRLIWGTFSTDMSVLLDMQEEWL